MKQPSSIIAVLCLGLLIPFIISAQQSQNPGCGAQLNGGYVLCTPIPGIDPVQKDFTGFLRQLSRLAFLIAGTVVFIRIVYGGFLYAFSGVVDQKNKAKLIFWNSAQGLALLMGSYIILYLVNPALVILQLPEAKNYFPSVSSQQFNNDFEKKYEDMMSGQAARLSRAAEEAKNNIQLINDEIRFLETVVDPSPEDTERLEELKNKRLPDAQKQSTLYQQNDIQFKINAISSQIEELESKKARSGNTTSRFFGITDAAFSPEEERRLRELYGQRFDLRLQKSGESDLLLKKRDFGKNLTPEEREEFRKMVQ